MIYLIKYAIFLKVLVLPHNELEHHRNENVYSVYAVIKYPEDYQFEKFHIFNRSNDPKIQKHKIL